jgi:hypothetical protein
MRPMSARSGVESARQNEFCSIRLAGDGATSDHAVSSRRAARSVDWRGSSAAVCRGAATVPSGAYGSDQIGATRGADVGLALSLSPFFFFFRAHGRWVPSGERTSDGDGRARRQTPRSYGRWAWRPSARIARTYLASRWNAAGSKAARRGRLVVVLGVRSSRSARRRGKRKCRRAGGLDGGDLSGSAVGGAGPEIFLPSSHAWRAVRPYPLARRRTLT